MLSAMAWSGAIYLLMRFSLRFYASLRQTPSFTRTLPEDSYGPLILTFILLATMIGSSIMRLKQIRDGGSSFIATSLGGRPLAMETNDEADRASLQRERVLGNIISEMAVAASISEPDAYILPKEEGVNAMACGLNPDDAAIIVTRGAIRRLSRDELSGVVAHELSHVINGDAAHFTIMAGCLHGLFALNIQGRRLAASSRSIGTLLFSFAVMALGSLAHLSGKLIMAAFCRRREKMADATAVQFTRDPLALAGALKKIGGFTRGSTVKSSAAIGLSHFFLAKPGKPRLFDLHPPLADRIWELDPRWDGWYHDFDENPVDYFADPSRPAGPPIPPNSEPPNPPDSSRPNPPAA